MSAQRLARLVHIVPGGGVRRDVLALKLGLPPSSPVFKRWLMIAYHRHQIDFCAQYVVKPPPGGNPMNPGIAELPDRLTDRKQVLLEEMEDDAQALSELLEAPHSPERRT